MMSKIESFLIRKGIAIAIYILIIGSIITITFLFINPFNDWSFDADSELFARYGDFIGGFIGTIFSLVATLLLYNTLVAQRNTLSKQDELLTHQKLIFEIGQFESTMFNIIKTQRELKDEIKATFYTIDENFKQVSFDSEGKNYFFYSKNELHKIWLSIDNDQYLGKFDEDYVEIIQQDIEQLYDPSSSSFTHPDDAKMEEQNLLKEERLKFANSFYYITKDRWEKLHKMETQKRLKSIYGFFFQKYHFALGHYFRHLYHILKFAFEFETKNKDFASISKKYIDFIQAQMSSYELMLLFYNALSFPKLLELIIHYNFLENLAEEDLVLKSHNCFEKIKLKKRRELLSLIVD
jgi:hypothetical protein